MGRRGRSVRNFREIGGTSDAFEFTVLFEAGHDGREIDGTVFKCESDHALKNVFVSRKVKVIGFDFVLKVVEDFRIEHHARKHSHFDLEIMGSFARRESEHRCIFSAETIGAAAAVGSSATCDFERHTKSLNDPFGEINRKTNEAE
jgi:hypothetical protein